MKLSETNEMIKADLMRFVNGEYDNYFTELSFLLNHITVEGDSVIFKYNNDKLKISGLISEDEIVHYIKSENIFKRSYKSFLREHKLNKLLGDDI